MIAVSVLGDVFMWNIREFKKLRRKLKRKKVFCNYSMLITLYEKGEPHFRLLGTIGFHVKTKSERCTAASSRCGQNLKYSLFSNSP